MLMEAMRLSLIEHEEQQRKEADKKRKEEAERAAKKGEGSGTGNGSATGEAASSSRVQLPPIPPASPIEVTRPHNREVSASSGSSPGSRGSPSSQSGRTPVLSSSPNVNNSSSLSTSVPRTHVPVVSSPLSAATTAGGGGSLSVAAAEAKSGSHSRSTSQSRSGSRAPTPQPTAQDVQFSTLSAALAGHGAASAILAAGTRDTTAPSPSSASNTVVETSVPIASSTSVPHVAPTAPPPPPPKEPSAVQTLPPSAAASGGIASDGPSTSSAADPPESQPGPEAPGTTVSSAAASIQSYHELPSSPESSLSHRPLLVETPTVENDEMNDLPGVPDKGAGSKSSDPERADSFSSM